VSILYIQGGAEETRFSYKNNFVHFQHKKVLITQNRRYFNAFLNNVSQMTSFLPDTFRASPQNPASHTPTFFTA